MPLYRSEKPPKLLQCKYVVVANVALVLSRDASHLFSEIDINFEAENILGLMLLKCFSLLPTVSKK